MVGLIEQTTRTKETLATDEITTTVLSLTNSGDSPDICGTQPSTKDDDDDDEDATKKYMTSLRRDVVFAE